MVAIVARTLDQHPRLPGSLNETASRIESHGTKPTVIVADLSNEDDRARIVPEAIDGLGGPIDILINNAAAGILQPILEVPMRRVRLSFEVNVLAGLDLAQQVAPAMRDRAEGWIINVTSGAADASVGPPFDLKGVIAVTGIYGTNKAALNRVTNALAAELWGTGVRINTIEPRSTILTRGTASFIDATPGGLGLELLDGEYETLEPMVEATLALCDCPTSVTGQRFVSVDLVREWGLEVRAIDGSPLPA